MRHKISKNLIKIELFGTFLAIFGLFSYFSVSVFALASENSDSTSGATQTFSTNIVSSLAVRLLNSTATSEISELNLALDAVQGGAFTKDSLIAQVSTNNKTGYKLYLESDYTSDDTYTTALVHQDNSDYTIPSLLVSASEADFSKNGGNFVNFWGYQKSYDSETSDFLPIPAYGSPDYLRGEDAYTATSNTTITIGVNADMSRPGGTYSNALSFTAISNPVPVNYGLNFSSNTTDAVSNLPANQSVTVIAQQYTFTIPDVVPSRSGYSFLGYSEDKDSSTADYQPGDSFTLIVDESDPENRSTTLYAIWKQINFWTITTMQEMTPEICSSVYTPSNAIGEDVNIITLASDNVGTVPGAKATYTVNNMAEYKALATADNQPYVAQRILSDIRDNNKYTIRKLADGECWMVSNLKLELEAEKDYIGSYNDGSTFTFNTGATCSNNNECMLDGNTVIEERIENGGYYYNWYAATAGAGTLQTVTDVDGSICPAGWKMPYDYDYRSEKSLGGLISSYLGETVITGDATGTVEAVPLNFSRAGYINYGSKAALNGTGFYWTSTAKSISTTAYRMNYSVNETRSSGGEAAKFRGFSIRCIAL